MIPIKVDDCNAASACHLRRALICLRVGLSIGRSLCIQIGICVLVKINLCGITRHRDGLVEIAPESDDLSGVAVITALRARIVFLVRRLEEDLPTSVVGTGLELQLCVLLVLESVESA